MDLAPLLGIGRSSEQSFFFLLGGLLLPIPVICCIDLSIFLLFLLWQPLVTWIKEPGSGLSGLDADICDCQQTGHHFVLFHGDLLDNLDITNPITEGIDDLDVLDVRDSIPDIAEVFHIILETLIVLLLNSLQGLSSAGALVCALEILDEHGT
jgi:hypothetical protein